MYNSNGNGKGKLDLSFDIPQDLKDQGVEEFRIINNNAFLIIKNGPTVLFPFDIKNYSKTIDKMRDKLAVYKIDDRLAEFYCVKITELLLIQLDIRSGNKKVNLEEERLKKETQFIIDSIKALREKFKEIPYEIWDMERKKRYDILRRTVEEKIPKAWEAIELLLTVKGIRHIEDIDLPLIVVIVGNPGTWKTLAIEMLRSWPGTYYKDKINPKSWISHAAKDDVIELEVIDLVRLIKNKMFLIPELAPIIMQDEKTLADTLSTLTRLADGQGLSTHSGLWGDRDVAGPVMFTMLGAVVRIHLYVYKVLAGLGPKIYFYNSEFKQASKQELVDQNMSKEVFSSKRRAIKEALFSYLQWLEVCPSLIEVTETVDNGSNNNNYNIDADNAKVKVINRAISWNKKRDDRNAIEIIAGLALLLAKVRGDAYAYQTKVMTKLHDKESGYQYEYGHDEPIEEEASRANQILYNITRAHAFEVHGRDYITEDDLIIPIRMALSAANRNRVSVIRAILTAKDTEGTPYKVLDTNWLASATKLTRLPLQKTLEELQALGLIDIDPNKDSDNESYFRLKLELEWVYEDSFQKLLERCYPRNG
jgi:hypothetical protein